MQCTHAAQESCYHNDRVVTNYKMLYDGGAIYNESYSYVSDVFDMTQLANFPPQKSITKRKGNSPSSSESVGVGSFQQTTVELTREIPMSPGSAVGNSLLLPSSACYQSHSRQCSWAPQPADLGLWWHQGTLLVAHLAQTALKLIAGIDRPVIALLLCVADVGLPDHLPQFVLVELSVARDEAVLDAEAACHQGLRLLLRHLGTVDAQIFDTRAGNRAKFIITARQGLRQAGEAFVVLQHILDDFCKTH